MTFEEHLAIGQLGESYIARWLNQRGWSVMPVYRKSAVKPLPSGMGI